MQQLVFSALKTTHTDFHGAMTSFRLVPITAKQSIPPGIVKAEIAVALVFHDGVMQPVHIRGHQK